MQNYVLMIFSVDVSVVAVVFRQISGKVVGFFKFVGEIRQLVRKRLQKIN